MCLRAWSSLVLAVKIILKRGWIESTLRTKAINGSRRWSCLINLSGITGLLGKVEP